MSRSKKRVSDRAHTSMLEFKVGERVSFEAEDGGRIAGMLVRYNQKTVRPRNRPRAPLDGLSQDRLEFIRRIAAC